MVLSLQLEIPCYHLYAGMNSTPLPLPKYMLFAYTHVVAEVA